MRNFINMFIFILAPINFAFAQFSPQAGVFGSSAIPKDSSVFVAWANSCSIKRGFIDISDTTKTYNGSNRATFGSDSDALGKADGLLNVVSLGDGGMATLTFANPICDGDGWDFAVFENGFLYQNKPQTAFLEFAFVEVSTDGIKFVRFPAVSNIQTGKQIGTFDYLDASQVNNLAGKYISGYGTPFDLHELKDSSGININNIRFVRIIDVVGSVNSNFASYDIYGNPINDPFPTPFNSGGFDLDAVGVINQTKITNTSDLTVFPNPVKDFVSINTNIEKIASISIYNLAGNLVFSQIPNSNTVFIDLSFLEHGIYILKLNLENKTRIIKLVKE